MTQTLPGAPPGAPIATDEPSTRLPEPTLPDTGRRVTSRLLRGRGLIGLALVVGVVALGIAAPLLSPYSPTEQLPNANLVGPSGAHLLGTDQVNRDVLTRVLFGIRVDIVVVFVAVPLGALIGTAIGVLSTLSSIADVFVQRAFDVMFAFPAIIFAIGLTAVIGPGLTTILAVVVAVEIPMFGRLVRTSILEVRALPYIAASEAIGASRWWVLRKHVLPNAAEPLFVQLALSMSIAVFLEGAMSFLGIGVRPPQPSLGSLISDSLDYLEITPMFAVGPLVVVAALALGFQFIAQAVGAERRG